MRSYNANRRSTRSRSDVKHFRAVEAVDGAVQPLMRPSQVRGIGSGSYKIRQRRVQVPGPGVVDIDDEWTASASCVAVALKRNGWSKLRDRWLTRARMIRVGDGPVPGLFEAALPTRRGPGQGAQDGR